MIKKFSLFSLGAALIAVPVLAAPGVGGKADVDGNGTVSRAEATTAATAMFAKMDANSDGKVDATDRAAKRAAMQAKMFERLDADKNGAVSKAEWDQNAVDRQAKRAEKRADRAEKRAEAGEPGKRGGPRMGGHHGKRGGHHGGPGGMGMKADTNGDKAISQAEFQTAALARFDATDANKDGQVTAEERQAQRGAWKAKRAAPASE